MTLTLCLRGRVISFSHRLTERNISVKFNKKNRLKGSGDMERIQNSWVNHLNLTRDPGLHSR